MAATVFVVRQMLVLGVVLRFIPPNRRLAVFLFGRGATRASLVYAVFLATAATLLADLIARLVVQPLVRAWLSPTADDSAGLFRLSASERVLGATPARRRLGWRWPAGTLVRTSQRVMFVPVAWDAEPWSVRPEELAGACLDPAAVSSWGLFRAFPERLAVTTLAGETLVFAVPDPDETLSWFRPHQAAPAPP